VSNSAQVGACISVFGCSLLVLKSNFRSNSAFYEGGAIFFQNIKTSREQDQNLYLFDSSFSQNKADIGAAIYTVNSVIGKLDWL
jgi:predicted outer membrane repeat protein